MQPDFNSLQPVGNPQGSQPDFSSLTPVSRNTASVPQQSLSDKIWGSLSQRGQNIVSDIQNTPNLAQQSGNSMVAKTAADLSTAGHVAGQVAGGVGDIIGNVISPLIPNQVKSGIGNVSQYINDKVNKIPGMTPDIHKSLGDVFNTLSLLGGEKATPTVTEAAKSGVQSATDIVKNTITKSPEDIAKTNYESALMHTTPNYEALSAAKKAEMASETIRTVNPDGTIKSVPRIQEGGILKGRTLTPTTTEKAAAQQLSQVPGYKPGMTALDTHNLIQGEITNQATTLRSSLKAEPNTFGVVNPVQEASSQVVKAINQVPEKSLLLSKSDPVIENYTRIVKNAITQNPRTLEGVLNLRQMLDSVYENARGKLAFGSDKIAPLDDIHQAARDTLNKYLIDHAQNTDTQGLLKAQSDLYRADDVVRQSLGKEGGSSIKRFTQNHPTATKIAKASATITGAGVIGRELLP